MECTQPKWILDRRDSIFFWRREEKECERRVKFRCDVQVVEFCPTDEYSEEIEKPSKLATLVSLALIAAMLSYQWFFN